MTEADFWKHTDRTGDCWLWSGGKNPKGYGAVWYAARVWGAHRLAYTLSRGPDPQGVDRSPLL